MGHKRGRIDAELSLAASALTVGETARFICPACQGGSTQEKSLAVTQLRDAVAYCCFRAQCGLRGYISDNPSMCGGKFFNGRPKINRAYTYPTHALSKEDIAFFTHKFYLNINEIEDIYKNIDRDTFVFVIRNYYGERIGVVDRSYTGRVPKSITYWSEETPVPKLHFATRSVACADRDKCYLTEDIISSIRVARHGVTAAALLGSHLTEANALWLADKFKHIVLMLDPDAVDKAIKIKAKWHAFFISMRVCLLERDPKDMTDKMLTKYVH